MKAKSFIFRLQILLTVVLLVSGCSRDLLVSRQQINQMDLVKVGAPDRELPAPAKSVTQEVAVVSEKALQVPADEQESVAAIPVRSELNPGVKYSGMMKSLNIPFPGNRSNAVKVSKIRSEGTETFRKILSADKENLTRMDRHDSRASETHPNFNLLRLILFILVVLLAIAILELILPGNLVYITLLVLLIAGILYFLGGI
jgi:hypothetical protein